MIFGRWIDDRSSDKSQAKLHFTFASSILSFAKPSAEVPYRPMTYFMGLLEWIETRGGVMKHSAIFLMILTLASPSVVFAATLQNTDSQEYEMQIKEEGRSYSRYYGPYGDEYRILEHCKTDICHYGCEMTLLDTGQKVWVNPRDEVVISYGVMK
jgi:hypothetical protein